MLINKLKINTPTDHANSIHFLRRAFNHPFPPIYINYISTTELENIAKTLKTNILTDMIKYQLKYGNLAFIISPLH